jgi:hypothetical protein
MLRLHKLPVPGKRGSHRKASRSGKERNYRLAEQQSHATSRLLALVVRRMITVSVAIDFILWFLACASDSLCASDCDDHGPLGCVVGSLHTRPFGGLRLHLGYFILKQAEHTGMRGHKNRHMRTYKSDFLACAYLIICMCGHIPSIRGIRRQLRHAQG